MALRFDYTEQADRYDATRGADTATLAALREGLVGAPGRALLDVGGGTGNYAEALGREGWEPTVVDVSPAMLERARAKGLLVLRADATALPLPDASVDAAMLVSMLHQVEHWRAALAEARRVLRPGGRLAVTGLFAEHLREVTWAYDLFPSMAAHALPARPGLADLMDALPGARLLPRTFRDAGDLSIAALCRFPERMLDPVARRQTSFFGRLEREHPDELAAGLATLAGWLAAGRRPEAERAPARARLGEFALVVWAAPASDAPTATSRPATLR